MLDTEKLNYYLGIFKNLDMKDLSAVFNLLKIRKLKAGEIFIQQGEHYKKISYIKNGLIRAYLIKNNGNEITTLLRWEDQLITSHDSILFDEPSRFMYQAIENTTLFEVDDDTAQHFMSKNSQLIMGRVHFLRKMLGESILNVETFILLTPEERYLKFIKDKPDIINRVPSKYIATLLGITPVSLSRIRGRIANQKKH
jgi:CRP-like cAMP-binding protein